MTSTLFFYNNDFHKQKPLRYNECMKMSIEEIMSIFYSGNYRKNTGTFLMTDCLTKILDAEPVMAHDFDKISNSGAQSIITNALHCISPRFVFAKDYWQKLLDTSKKIVPMTFGFRYHENGDFYLTDEMLRIISQISERNEIGVRGEYVADTLSSYGIKNIRVVGCHSLFYHMDSDFKVTKRTKKLQSVNFNFNQCYQDFFENHLEFCKNSAKVFNYIFELYKKGTYEIDYTMQTAFLKELTGFGNFTNYNEVKDFAYERGRYFFSVDDWIQAVGKNDFTIGTQFHGTVASILAGTPALLIAIDKRAEELAKYHEIPYIKVADFDPGKPLDFYYELADYTKFNSQYSSKFNNFIEYCTRNEVALKSRE